MQKGPYEKKGDGPLQKSFFEQRTKELYDNTALHLQGDSIDNTLQSIRKPGGFKYFEVTEKIIRPLNTGCQGRLVFNNNPTVKDRLQHARLSDGCYVTCQKAKTVKHILWECNFFALNFCNSVSVEYHILFVAPLHWKGVIFEEQWMIRQMDRYFLVGKAMSG